MKRTLLWIGLVALATAAHAQQFRWVDKDGRVQYGDSPPPGAKVTPLKPPPGPAAQPASAASKDAAKDAGKDAKKALTPEEAFRKRQEEARKAEEKAAQEKAEAEKRKTNCANAQARLRDLESGTRIAQTNEKGERVFMDDAVRQREAVAARQSVSEWCK